MVPFARYHIIAWQVKGHWSIASGRRGPVNAQQTLYREIYDKQLHSKAKQFQLSTIFYLFLSLHVRTWIPWAMTLLILTPIPISAIYPSSMDPQSFDQWYEITIYPKLSSVYPFFSNATNLLYNSYSFSCIKRNSENIESLIEHQWYTPILMKFCTIFHWFDFIMIIRISFSLDN